MCNQLHAGGDNFLKDTTPVVIIDPLVVSETPLQLSMPAPFMRIPPGHLDREEGISLQPILNRVPGLFMQSGALNTNRISFRGIGSRSPFSTTRIRVYLDDIPLTSGDGTTSLEDFDLSLIHEVKVWKGPTASIYGAGLGGMIHLKTPDLIEKNPQLNLGSSIGSFGLFRQTISLHLPNQDATSCWRILGHHTQRLGYRENSSFLRQGGSILNRTKISEKQSITFFSNLTRLEAEIPSSLDSLNYVSAPQQAAPNWLAVNGNEQYDHLQLGVSHRWSLAQNEKWELESRTSLFFRFRDALESRPFNILEEQSKVGGTRIQLALLDKKRPADPFPSLSVGVEYFSEKLDWKTLETNSGKAGALLSNNVEHRQYSNVFLQGFRQLTPDLSLLMGLNWNSTNYRYRDLFFADSMDLSGDYSFEPIWSPRIGLSYRIGYLFSIFGTVSHGFAAPTLAETLRPDGVINPNIRPEQGWNFEIGSRGKFGQRFSYEVAVYRMLVEDLLVPQRVGPDQFVGVNAGKTLHQGLEWYMDANVWTYPNRCLIYLSYTLSDYHFLDFQSEEGDLSGNYLPGTSPHQLTAGIDVETSWGLYGNGSFIFVGRRPILDDNSLFADPYSLVDLKIGYRRQVFRSFGIDLFAGIRNLANEQYASMLLINAGSFGGALPRYYYPGLPRNFYCGVRLQYRML